MHRTKVGEFKYLVVIIHEEEELESNHMFFDKDDEALQLIQREQSKKPYHNAEIKVLKDLNYLLNEMVKNKGSRLGKELYKIYVEAYPDDEQKKKVIEFWNKEI